MALSRTLWKTSAGVVLISSAAYVLYRVNKHRRERPLSLAEWNQHIASADTSTALQVLLQLVSTKGLAPELRRHAWPYLLDLFLPEPHTQGNLQRLDAARQQYTSLLQVVNRLRQAQCNRAAEEMPDRNRQALRGDTAQAREEFRRARTIIMMDAVRTDYPANLVTKYERDSELDRELLSSELSARNQRAAQALVNLLCAYAVYDPDIGYCQGMSDLALPFVVVLKEEALAFACFKNMMKIRRRNFLRDGSGVQKQLEEISTIIQMGDPELAEHLQAIKCSECFFAHRMLLVMFRRDLCLEQTMRLWEMIWAKDKLRSMSSVSIGSTSPARPSMLLFVVAAAVCHQRKAVMRAETVDEILQIFILQRLQLRPLVGLAQRLSDSCPGR